MRIRLRVDGNLTLKTEASLSMMATINLHRAAPMHAKCDPKSQTHENKVPDEPDACISCYLVDNLLAESTVYI